jgi:F-type H+-transporting ATPase subunit alpha
VGKEIVSIWAGTTGKLDDIEVADIRRFETDLLAWVAHHDQELLDVLPTLKKFDDDTAARLEKLVDEFKNQFQPSVAAAGE